MSKIVNVILSGGVGSRLWPLSRKAKPKQYLNIFDGRSLFELTILRNQDLVSEVMLVGSVENIDLAKKSLQDFKHQIIVEAVPRNTAAAIAFAALAVEPDTVLVITPSDHLVEKAERYEKAIKQGVAFAKEGYISTFGIQPTYPETGYGYIEYNGSDVVSFREKPNEQTAKDFLSKGDFLWNSGIFCFQASTYLKELERYAPKVYVAAKYVYDHHKEGVLDAELSLSIPSISIDYAVMEKSEKIKVVPSDFVWSDMGSFESLYEYLKSQGHPIDENGNMALGEQRYTRFLGLTDTLFIGTEDAVLILNKASSQDVKGIYEELQQEKSSFT